MQQSDVILSVRDLTKIFKTGKTDVIAVDHVNFDIHSKEIISLVGQSGSGKTTIGKMLLTLLKPTSGEILFKGKTLKEFMEKEGKITYLKNVQGVFQDPFSSFNQFFSIKKNLKRCFKLIDPRLLIKKKDKLIEEALELVNIDPGDVMEKFPFELSGGQRQRIMLARIFLIRPKLLIADEPTSMIDATLRSGILKLLLELREKEDLTILFITHDMGLAYYISDRIFIMHKGKIVEKGTADEIILYPKHEYTKELISDVPVLSREWL